MSKAAFVFLSLAVVFSSHVSASLSEFVKHYADQNHFHGNILVQQGEQVLYEKSFGLANEEWSISHTKDSKFMIASLSKSFTATLILLLAQEGELSLEDPLSKYLPSLGKKNESKTSRLGKIKIKHLLNHTSGLKRDFVSTAYMNRSAYNSLNYIVISLLQNDTNLFNRKNAGEFSYSNLGYLFLAYVIEEVAFLDYETVLKEKILNPGGLSHTGHYNRQKVLKHMTSGYHYSVGGKLLRRCCDDASSLIGAASLYSTASDLNLWLDFLLKSMNYKKRSLMQKIFEDYLVLDAETLGSGLSSHDFYGTKRIYANGHEWGYLSSLNYFPEEDLRVLVLSNRHGALGLSQNINLAEDFAKEVSSYILFHAQ